MGSYCLHSERELCWDFELVKEKQGISLQMHKPVRQNTVLRCDMPWEGDVVGYMSFLKVGDTYRLYYRPEKRDLASQNNAGKPRLSLLESKDGIHFTRANVGRLEYNGDYNNNIVFDKATEPGDYFDNFSVYYDPNPACPEDEKFKALASYSLEGGGHGLMYYKSTDGLTFTEVRPIPVEGTFDTLNTVSWDEKTQQYFVFTRGFHREGVAMVDESILSLTDDIRDIRVSTSKDFETWEQHGRLDFGADAEDLALYINNIVKYPRAKNMFIGMPVRYCDRIEDRKNFDYLTRDFYPATRQEMINEHGRIWSVITDCVLITSRDGYHFNRTNEAFLGAGLENAHNWLYGDGYTSWGLLETPSSIPGNPDEISFFTAEACRSYQPPEIVRYSVRLDGFFSWHADYAGGEVLTKPFILSGSKMNLNFETSALGHVAIQICDENGTAIDGYNSGKIFGNSVSRNVDFEKPLEDLQGQTVCLRINMKESELYSFIFE